MTLHFARDQTSVRENSITYATKSHSERVKLSKMGLTEQQAQVLAEWIENGRQLNEILGQMEAIALRITDRVLKQLPQRAMKR